MSDKARCMKCKKDIIVKDSKYRTMPNGARAVTGTCPTCSTKVFRFMKKEK